MAVMIPLLLSLFILCCFSMIYRLLEMLPFAQSEGYFMLVTRSLWKNGGPKRKHFAKTVPWEEFVRHHLTANVQISLLRRHPLSLSAYFFAGRFSRLKFLPHGSFHRREKRLHIRVSCKSSYFLKFS